MSTETDFPETLHEAIRYFAEGDTALNFMIGLRWPDRVAVCPRCEQKGGRFIATRKVWECPSCKKQYSVKQGTIFEESPIKLDKWLSAIWLIANAKNGISSYEIHRALGVTQKTGWFMLHRIRLAMQTGSFEKLKGNVEVDETYIGGKARLMNAKTKANRKAKYGKATGGIAMTPVQGLLERSTKEKASRVALKVIKSTKKAEVQEAVREYVLHGSTVHTDELHGYKGLNDAFTHEVINHAETYVRGHVHTNGMENFWSVLKRTIKGTYVNVEPFHLFRYLDEQAFRFNEREDDDQGRFLKAVVGIIGRRLRWSTLTAEPSDCLPSPA
jgi:transposase-like protein